MGAANSTITNGCTDVIHEGQDALWLVEENFSKASGQKKKRQERDTCINNINLNLSSQGFTKEKLRHSQRPQRRYALDCTYTKKSRNKLLQGSLENVSSNPFGEFDTQQSTLRRSRSLAISRESLFANLDLPISNCGSSRRHQLIPRAKLIDRNGIRDRRSLKERTPQDTLHANDRHVPRKRSSFSSEFGGSQINHQTIQKSYHSSSNSTRRTSIENSQYHLSAFSTSTNPQVDNLVSNYYKPSIHDRFRENQVDCGLSLPNYYPDSRCETDISLTDISIDNISIKEPNYSQDNISTNNLFYRETPSPERASNIFYHDNISFGKNVLDNLEEPKSKPRTIRQYTPQAHETDHFYGSKPQSLPNYSILLDELNEEEYKEHIYDTVEKATESQRYEELEAKLNLNCYQSDFADEIQDELEKGAKETDFDACDTYLQENSIYDEVLDIQRDSLNEPEIKALKEVSNNEQKEILKTRVQVPAEAQIYSVVKKGDKADDFKTIVQVEQPSEKSPKDKRHSHKYFKEFLESQKGSKKPLQNFLSKKISRAFGEPKKPTETESNLETNQYHSLPDLSVGNNLRQCEKIDRKLRKCEKNEKLTTSSNNRFIVNIGRHFDVTAESNIPVDFEVKISKIPKLKKAKKNSKNTENKHQLFINAVKNLNETLNGLSLDQAKTKPHVVDVTTKTEPKFKNSTIKRLSQPKHRKNKEEKVDKTKIKPLPKINEVEPEPSTKMNKEYQQKIGTMRTYWGKLTSSPERNQDKCKVIDVHTKVEEVIKKFEPKEIKEEKPESLVNTVKQVFEPKIVQKAEKLSPFVKESCDRFENHRNNQYESLNPNIVEIIEKEERTNNTDDEKSWKHCKLPVSKHKTVVKSKSASIDPEFDHVRYRVMKSDMFQKNIFANCQKESQFNGLMQYLQDFSFQELLIDNNIVIIEPIRTNIPHEASQAAKTSQNITSLLHRQFNEQNEEPRRKFFYHPIRVNKEMNEDELPNPDTVKQVRLMFESGLKKSKSTQELDTATKKTTVQYRPVDPDKDVCSASDSNSNPSQSEMGSSDNLTEPCCEQQYISEDVLQKIRQCGTSVTYYGGRVLNKRHGTTNPMTHTIMEEIKDELGRDCINCKNGDHKESYHGIKFKLLKSNSCSSRLELVGTKNLSSYKEKFFKKQKMLIEQKNRENQQKDNYFNEQEEKLIEKPESETPKIIATTGKKMTQWGKTTEKKTFNNINFSKTNNSKANYDYHNYKQLKSRAKKINDMEFETYEVVGN